MSIVLHVLNAHGRLSDIRSAVEAAFDEGLARIRPMLPIDGVDVLLCNDPKPTVPELGLGGYSPSGSRCFLFIDPAHSTLRAALPVRVLSFLAQELHHCLRWRGPDYGNTLPEALMSEGLACHFEAEVTRGPLPIYATSLAASELASVQAVARAEGAASPYDHHRWFYGTGDLPRWSGDALGASLVGQHLATTRATAASLAGAPLVEALQTALFPCA